MKFLPKLFENNRAWAERIKLEDPAYFERLIARPSVARVLDEAKPWFPYFPFKELLPQRFL